MDKGTRTWLLLIILMAAVIIAVVWAVSLSLVQLSIYNSIPPYHIPGDIEFYYVAQAVVSSVNIVILIFLLSMYTDLYTKTRSEFTIGLMVFSVIFLLYAFASNPFVIQFFGFQEFGLGPFALLPDLFTSAALLVLLYLSFRY